MSEPLTFRCFECDKELDAQLYHGTCPVCAWSIGKGIQSTRFPRSEPEDENLQEYIIPKECLIKLNHGGRE